MEKLENIDNSTPLMSQYNGIKKQYANEILLFRVGDFYETFNNDAVETAKILNITLTKKSNGASSKIPLAGFPYHALDNYLPKLVAAGKRVAICEQLEEPQKGKKIVKRGVTEIITPGVVLNEQLLVKKENNFLMSVHVNKELYGISLIDVSTGDFIVAEGNFDYLQSLIHIYKPSEIIYQKNKKLNFENDSLNLYPIQEWAFDFNYCYDMLVRQFETTNLKGFGIEELKEGIISAGVILIYLEETRNSKLHHITTIRFLEKENYLWMDRFTVNNLELIHSNNSNALTVLNIIDFTKTHMGSRLLKYWLVFPLKIIDDILTRQAIVEFFFLTKNIKDNVSKELSFIQDMERILTKIITYKINPSQLKSFLEGLKSIQKIKEMLIYSENNELIEIANNIIDNNLLISYIENILSEDPPVQFHNGNVVKSGFSKELDELRDLKKNAKIFVENYKAKEIEKTGINSLKIDYNSVFGYYIEIRNTHKDKVPEHWIRKQTLVNAERYFTNELKEFEIQILSAEDKIIALEKNIFLSLLDNITAKTKIIQNNTKKIAEIDCLLSLAICGLENNFVKPEINNSLELIITEGRHPVIEKKIQNKEAYISNNTYLGSLDQQIIMLTGPNMAGKSALLRQTAIIVILAQMGGYIPANGAKIGLIDKIFTRVGASDNISNNESTFMVEMNETANILNNLSNRSLILLDEIGRGTSTYDGVSLAWAVAEYLHEHRTQAKTIFATHYHELNEMATQFKKIKNFNVSIKEFDGKILFLRKLVPGGVAHSFGIHVARMAGIPKKVIDRAEKILEKLEEKKVFNTNKIVSKINNAENKINLNLFNQNDSLLQDIKVDLKKIDINTLTPIEALFKLNEIKNKLFNG